MVLDRPHKGRGPVFGTDYPTPDGTCVRDIVKDLAVAHHRPGLPGRRPSEMAEHVFNVGTGQSASVREVVLRSNNLHGAWTWAKVARAPATR